ncbi:hypothetical protein SAMN02745945_01810 [Peptoclostridium litorale DSM 5388]|uniref:Uncharacterized protein n=1 Tax=Peptoclostridium litorale DSM 5388 TaxID=1121324 RepID=A0A069RFW9_PEPLI|nr:hypothetical protein [Peptoclostridium litorale]KDR95916.1 hypothetical protein CLIT_8c00850 [Peptoclostridium litorale DSM 5388]SIO10038.1 hypothetical protein SAMN02745945_01810 [Peptoclostridium litorale DSM 5388]
MAKCVLCSNKNASYEYSEGGYVCEHCMGSNFTCPDCGRVFPRETGDSGTGFCAECAHNH